MNKIIYAYICGIISIILTLLSDSNIFSSIFSLEIKLFGIIYAFLYFFLIGYYFGEKKI